MRLKQVWIVTVAKWLAWKELGQKIISARKLHGKTIRDYNSFPDYVKLSFDMNDEYRTIESFKDEEIIKEYIKNGAIVKQKNSLMTQIVFTIDWSNYHKKNPNASIRAKNAKRDNLGKFIK